MALLHMPLSFFTKYVAPNNNIKRFLSPKQIEFVSSELGLTDTYLPPGRKNEKKNRSGLNVTEKKERKIKA